MSQKIKDCILAIHESLNEAEKREQIKHFINAVYLSPKLYVVLSEKFLNEEAGRSLAFLTKNREAHTGQCFLFSDLELAKAWARQHGHILNEKRYLIGELFKNDYDQFFKGIAIVGITHALINEDFNGYGFKIEDLFSYAKINPYTVEEFKKIDIYQHSPIFMKVLD